MKRSWDGFSGDRCEALLADRLLVQRSTHEMRVNTVME
jgi:hypothetical protein